MAKGSDNLFPYLHLVPAAAPAAPAVGAERIYLDSADGNKLKRKNSAGTVTTVEGGGGGTGETTWTAPTLENSWVNFGAPYASAGYRKDSNGIVHLRGLVKSGVIGIIFTLPTGYRPPSDHLVVTHSSSNPSSVIVRAAGGVEHNGGGTGYFSLDGISFYTT